MGNVRKKQKKNKYSFFMSQKEEENFYTEGLVLEHKCNVS